MSGLSGQCRYNYIRTFRIFLLILHYAPLSFIIYIHYTFGRLHHGLHGCFLSNLWDVRTKKSPAECEHHRALSQYYHTVTFRSFKAVKSDNLLFPGYRNSPLPSPPQQHTRKGHQNTTEDSKNPCSGAAGCRKFDAF